MHRRTLQRILNKHAPREQIKLTKFLKIIEKELNILKHFSKILKNILIIMISSKLSLLMMVLR